VKKGGNKENINAKSRKNVKVKLKSDEHKPKKSY